MCGANEDTLGQLGTMGDGWLQLMLVLLLLLLPATTTTATATATATAGVLRLRLWHSNYLCMCAPIALMAQ
jgi:hypothetical protein